LSFLLSTRLYPEWPFAKIRHTDNALAHKVSIALLRMQPETRAAKSANIVGWTIPLDYQPVHELMKELRIGTYENYGKVTLSSAVQQYWYWVMLGFLTVVLMAFTTMYVLRLNRTLTLSKQHLQEAREGLECQVREREKLIAELQAAFAKVKLLSGFLPICASCKKIRDDKGYWNQIETYISQHSEAEFSHGYCPDCAEKKFRELEDFKKKHS
jgi:two-component system sensor histidine kinase TtrS